MTVFKGGRHNSQNVQTRGHGQMPDSFKHKKSRQREVIRWDEGASGMNSGVVWFTVSLLVLFVLCVSTRKELLRHPQNPNITSKTPTTQRLP